MDVVVSQIEALLYLRRLKKGRPNSTRIRTEMDEEAVERALAPRQCGLCRHTGHIRKNCLSINNR